MFGILESFTLISEDLKQLSMKPEAVLVNLGYPSIGNQRQISQGIHLINIRKVFVHSLTLAYTKRLFPDLNQ